jgi:hypothetical protein
MSIGLYLKRARYHAQSSYRTRKLRFSDSASLHYYRYNTIALHQYKTVYFYITKAACTTLKARCADILYPNRNHSANVHQLPFPSVSTTSIYAQKIFPNRDHSAYGQLLSPFHGRQRSTPAGPEGYFCFTFVRNPWDRVVSFFSNKVQGDLYAPLKRYKGFSQGMSFQDTVRAIAEIDDENSDEHFASQYTFIFDESGRRLVDFVGRFEYLERDWREVCDRSGITFGPLKQSNATRVRGYREFYTPELQRIIADRYHDDIELFGYEF